MTLRPISEAELHAYADGQLDPQRLSEVEDHLANHPEEAMIVSSWSQQNARLIQALQGVLEEPLPARLALHPFETTQWRAAGFRRALLAASIAFVTGAFVGTGGILLAQHSGWSVATQSDVGSSMARAALDAHRVFIPEILHPVEVGSDKQRDLLQWLSRRLGYTMVLPDLKAEGYLLLGGRLLAGERGPAAFFMFEKNDGTRMTLYCGSLGPVPDTSFRYSEGGGFGTVYWMSEDVGFALTGPTTHRAELQRVAHLVVEAMEQDPRGPS